VKTILIINESSLIRDFLSLKLQGLGLNVDTALNGFDGQMKMRSAEPDLIILDYFLSRVSSIKLLTMKNNDPNLKDLPVIMLVGKLSKERILELAKMKVNKFYAKPIKIDGLIKGISELLNIEIKIDDTPCIIDAHYNEGILFIEVARGLNSEKIDLLSYKIAEILKLYEAVIPKVLIIMTDVQVAKGDLPKFNSFLTVIRESTHTPLKGIKILTPSDSIPRLLQLLPDFKKVEVCGNINEAMDKLLGVKVSDWMEEGVPVVRQEFIMAEKTDKEAEETIHLQFAGEKGEEGEEQTAATWDKETAVSVVDDDPVIRELVKATFAQAGCKINAYENGKLFMEDLDRNTPDLIFLDLLMPEMDGFTVLKNLKKRDDRIPVIVLSALSKKETVVKALSFGVRSYLIKPLKPNNIMRKAAEALKTDF
jgi:DNA-binding response OmpR family regulator